jgi:DNA-binding NarL/FixJ family response regulator
LIDDNPAEREGVVALMRTQPGFQILTASAEFQEALDKVRETTPDVVLLNLRHDGDGGLTLAGALHGEVPQSRVIMMRLEPAHEDVASLVRAGVSGFIMAGASFNTFLRTVRSVAEGNQVLPLELTRSLFGQLNRHSARGHPKRMLEIRQLTDREREVADLIIQGLGNQEIATRLRLALDTVKCHVREVLSKLAGDERLQVAAFAQNARAPVGLIPSS